MKKPPSTTRVTKSSKPVAARPSGRQPKEDIVLSLLKKANRPVNLQSYLNVAYFGQKQPEDLGPEEVAQLPPKIRKEYDRNWGS